MTDRKFILPTHFIPTHYDISLDQIDTVNNLFSGHVCISLRCKNASNEIHLNMRDIIIDKIGLVLENHKSIQLINQDYDRLTEVLVITAEETIFTDFKLVIDYRGIIQKNMSGFYRSDFKDQNDNVEKFMLSTQFQATDARRAFPCFDEPAHKATFKVKITTHEKFNVLSNMPLEETSKHNTQKTHYFHRTPLMSPYLVAWAIGEFEYIESKTKQKIYSTLNNHSTADDLSKNHDALPVRIYTAKGKSKQGQFALSVATKVVDYFSELFNFPYPLPKLDLLCVESYSHNAMENFSLITFRPTALLYDGENYEENCPPALKKIAYVVCHEIAHQWFGNLVTMKWWDELWLNEGFATWVGYHAISKLFPDWNVPSMVMLNSHEVALGLDSLKKSHPVKVDVRDPKDIDQVFDSISYLKGCSVLEMISGYLGEEIFLKGVALYLNRNKFSNATMEDLCNCISEVSDVDILSRIKPWLLETGFPILTVAKENGKLKLSQQKFCNLKAEQYADTGTKWWVPLMLTKSNQLLQHLEFDTKTTELEANHDVIYFNTDSYAFYRVKYESEEVTESILLNLDLLSSRSKMGLIADTCAICPLSKFLHLISLCMKLHDSKELYVWKIISSCLSKIRTIIFKDCERELLNKYDAFILDTIEPWIQSALDYLKNPELMLQAKKDHSRFLRAQFYDCILLIAGRHSHENVVDTCTQIFLRGKVSAFNRLTVLGTILSQPGTSIRTFNTIRELLKSALLEEKETILSCLGSVKNHELFGPCLNLLFEIEPMNVQFLASAWGKNPDIHASILDFLKIHHAKLFDRLKVNQVVIGRFVSFTFEYFTGSDAIKDLELIFQNEDISLFDRSLLQTLEKVEYNTAYADENIPSLREFFQRSSNDKK